MLRVYSTPPLLDFGGSFLNVRIGKKGPTRGLGGGGRRDLGAGSARTRGAAHVASRVLPPPPDSPVANGGGSLVGGTAELFVTGGVGAAKRLLQ